MTTNPRHGGGHSHSHSPLVPVSTDPDALFTLTSTILLLQFLPRQTNSVKTTSLIISGGKSKAWTIHCSINGERNTSQHHKLLKMESSE